MAPAPLRRLGDLRTWEAFTMSVVSNVLIWVKRDASLWIQLIRGFSERDRDYTRSWHHDF